MRRKELKMSRTGKIALGILTVYIIIALVVPALPLRNPTGFHAPPQDIFVPQIVNQFNFSVPIDNFAVYGYDIFAVSNNGIFIHYDMIQHKTVKTFNINSSHISGIKILRAGAYGVPIFHTESAVYLYSPTQERLYRMDVRNTYAIYPIQIPFSQYTGFIAVNSTGVYAYSYNPYTDERQSFMWNFSLEKNVLGIHYSYTNFYISTPDRLIALNDQGRMIWSIDGNFTSNPIYIPVYGNNIIYVASGTSIMGIFMTNGSYATNISMAVKITHLHYYGQSLYAYSPRGIVGKVNTLSNRGFLWKIGNIKEYSLSSSVDGMGAILKDGRLIFVLTGDGTVQWGTKGNFTKIALGEQDLVPYLFALLNNEKSIVQYSYSGKLITPLPPSKKYLLGTDSAGRDVLSQLLWGFRNEIYIAFVSGFAVLILGTLWGLTAGYFSGLPDDLLLLLSDSFLFIPAIGYAALMIYLFGIQHHIMATITASILALSPLEARAVRNYTKVIKEKPFVESAKVSGAGFWRIMFKHILPEIKGISMVYALSATTMALLLEVGISFLGFGNYAIPTWGWMITNAYFTGYLDKWWLVAPPLIALWLLVYSLYLLSQEMYTTEYVISIESRTLDEE